MCAITHADAGALGIKGHLQVMGGIADHQRASWFNAELSHQFIQHPGMRLASSLVSRT